MDKGYEMHICFYGEDVITCRLFMVAMAGLAISEIVKVYIYISIYIYMRNYCFMHFDRGSIHTMSILAY